MQTLWPLEMREYQVMTKPAATMGDYIDAKFMRGLKVTRLSIDIPIEESEQFFKMFGTPNGADPVKVVIARLAPPTAEPLSSGAPAPSTPPNVTPLKDTRTYSRSQMAAILCDDPAFQGWASTLPHNVERRQHFDNSDFTRAILLEVLGITSRKELDTLPHKGELWDRIKTDFDVRAYQ